MSTTFQFKNLAEFLGHFKDEETCKRHFEAIRFRDGAYCAHCGHKTVYKFSGGKRYRCGKCRQDFTIKTNTVFGESKLPLKKWFIAIYLLTTSSKGISSVQLAKHVGVTQKTAWFMDHRIRSALKQNKGQLFGTVEVDETYIGGREKNKHASKRLKKTKGRSLVGKTPIIGLMQRDGEVRATVADEINARTIGQQVVEHVKIGSNLFTDDFGAYYHVGKFFFHAITRHGQGEYARDSEHGRVHSNSIESFWALFKRGYHGIYHQMSRKHLQAYVNEFAYRFNQRAEDLQTVFSDVVEKVSLSSKLPYKKLTHQAA